MSLPWNVNASMGGAGVNYQIQRSLRFRSSASGYLSRTPSSASNRTTFTQSFWAKRGDLSRDQAVVYSYNPGTGNVSYFINFFGDDKIRINSNNEGVSANWDLRTTQVFRDPSAWYHIVVAVDTTQATSTDRVKVYINGVQVTSFSTATYPSLNFSNSWNNTVPHGISRSGGNFDGYLADFYAIDGQQLTPSSFGYNDPVTGVWQPAPFKGTYGTNGFYLPFTDIATTSGSNFGLGRDYSGNANYWTTNNISVTSGATYDSMIDSPTNFSDGTGIYNRGNYATFNSISQLGSGSTFSNANLRVVTPSSGDASIPATIFVTAGKWYVEFTVDDVGAAGSSFGLVDPNMPTATSPGLSSLSYGYLSDGQKRFNSTTSAYGNSFTTGDLLGCALDLDNGKVWWAKNGTWQASGDPAAGTNAAFSSVVGPLTFAWGDRSSAATTQCTANFGQRPFTYTPPTGFKALNTFNLPTPTIPNGAAYMAATLWTGNGSTRSISNGANTTIGTTFQPDLVWIKGRSFAYSHLLFDSIRGAGFYLSSNNTNAEATLSGLTSFNAGGFSLGVNANANNSGTTYVGWQWNAGSGSSSSNTSGSITSTVSANTTAGFSVVTYTGTGAVGTIGHGLGVAPSMMIVKRRSTTGNWPVYHISVGNNQGCFLNLTNAVNSQPNFWNSTTPTSSVFTVGTDTETNQVSQTLVAYCFAAVRGYSAFGSYTGNGSSDGPFIYTGFRPRWVMIKSSSGVGVWNMIDSSRSSYNMLEANLEAQSSGAETGAGTQEIDLLSNGFKYRGSSTNASYDHNASGVTYIYAAFAENPFNYSRAR